MSDISEFFLGSMRAVVQLETLEISHPNFSKIYRIVRNARQGVNLTLEDASSQAFEYQPIKISNLGSRDDLDTGIAVSFNDLGQIVPKELDRIDAADGNGVTPIVKYRAYRSDDLTAPLIGPFTFEVKAMTFNKKGTTFEAKAPRLNYNTTGEIYTVDRFPMLRGFL